MKNYAEGLAKGASHALKASRTNVRAPSLKLTDTPSNKWAVRSARDEQGVLGNVTTRKETTIRIYTHIPVLKEVISAFPFSYHLGGAGGARVQTSFNGYRPDVGKKNGYYFGTEASHDNFATISCNNRSLSDIIISQLIVLEQNGIDVIERFSNIWKLAVVNRDLESDATSVPTFINRAWIPAENRTRKFLMPVSPIIQEVGEAQLLVDVQTAGLQVQSTFSGPFNSVLESVIKDIKSGLLVRKMQGTDKYHSQLIFKGDGLHAMEAILDTSKQNSVGAGYAIDVTSERISALCDEISDMKSLPPEAWK